MKIYILVIILTVVLLFGYKYQKREHYKNYIFNKQLPNPFYEQNHYPNMNLPSQVIGCGARNTPCLGGTQIPIANPMSPIDISEKNIAPTTVKIENTHNGFNQSIIQVGLLYKIFGNYNTYIPLYYNNDEKFYFIYYKNSVMKLDNSNYGVNDELVIDEHKYRVTIYQDDTPQFVGYGYN